MTFTTKVRARMAAALTQSEGAWLPVIYPDATPERAAASAPAGTRLLLDPDGPPLLSLGLAAPVTIAVGPEGGVERTERDLGPGADGPVRGEITGAADDRDLLVAAGFAPSSLGGHILRFETAAVGALAVVRAALQAAGHNSPTSTGA